MKEWFKGVNDWIREGLPLMVFISWLCMVMFVVKSIIVGQVR